MCLLDSDTGDRQPTRRRRQSSKDDGGLSAKVRVLVVEDDPLINTLLTTVLERNEFTVTTAADGDRALELFREDTDIQLLITDLALPGMRGFDLAAEVKRLNPDVKVLVMSGSEAISQESAVGTGPADAFLAKPFKPAQLISEVKQLLGENAA